MLLFMHREGHITGVSRLSILPFSIGRIIAVGIDIDIAIDIIIILVAIIFTTAIDNITNIKAKTPH